jgi:DNA-binding transcriptional regulator YiaG
MEEVKELLELAKSNGISQERLARILGVSYFTLYRWKAQKSKPSYLARERIRELIKKLKNENKNF